MIKPVGDLYRRLVVSMRQRVRARLWGDVPAQQRLRARLRAWDGVRSVEDVFQEIQADDRLRGLVPPLRRALDYETRADPAVPEPAATARALVRALRTALRELEQRRRMWPDRELPEIPEPEPERLHPPGVEPRSMALVISGGGAKGAFAVGALSYLVVEGGLQFGIVVGTSTGALIAPLLVTGEMAELVNLYERVTTGDILRRRFFPLALLKGSLYSTRPLRRLIDRYLTDAHRWARLTAAQAAVMFVSTVNMQTGAIVYGSNRDPVDTAQGGRILRQKILASASEPVLMPPVDIPHVRRDGRRYRDQFVDGGIRELAPFRRAIEAGAERILGLLLQPAPERRTPVPRLCGIRVVAERTVALFVAEVGDNDEGTARLINQVRTLIATVRDRARRLGIDPDELFAGTQRPFERYRVLGITLIRPDTELGSSLRFEPLRMRAWMDLGYRTALRTAAQACARGRIEMNGFTPADARREPERDGPGIREAEPP